MKINGKAYDHKKLSLRTFLDEHQINEKMVVVEVNGTIVEQSNYDDRQLKADDKVEIVSFVGGG